MEPITTTAAATVVGYLTKTLKDNQSIKDFFDDFTEATVNWLKPIFIKEDGSEKDVIQELKKNLDSKIKQNGVINAIESEIENNRALEKLLQELAVAIASKTGNTISPINTSTVKGDGNTVVQGVQGSTITIHKQG